MTGAGGLLGGRLAALLAEHGHAVTAVHGRRTPPPGLRAVASDLTEPGAVERLLEAETPAAVVHAAVIGRADDCETNPALAERVNTRLPEALARSCAARGLRLVALSTDLVFAGDRAFATEDAPARPASVYGRTKLAGEQAALAACPGAAVARVALVLGRGHGPRATSSESVAQALRDGREQRLFADELRTPIDPESVADAVARLLAGEAAGVFHLGGPERLSRLALGERVARALGLPRERLVSALQRDYAGPERRAPDVSLDSSRARRELGWRPRPLDEAIRESRLSPTSPPAGGR